MCEFIIGVRYRGHWSRGEKIRAHTRSPPKNEWSPRAGGCRNLFPTQPFTRSLRPDAGPFSYHRHACPRRTSRNAFPGWRASGRLRSSHRKSSGAGRGVHPGDGGVKRDPTCDVAMSIARTPGVDRPQLQQPFPRGGWRAPEITARVQERQDARRTPSGDARAMAGPRARIGQREGAGQGKDRSQPI